MSLDQQIEKEANYDPLAAVKLGKFSFLKSNTNYYENKLQTIELIKTVALFLVGTTILFQPLYQQMKYEFIDNPPNETGEPLSFNPGFERVPATQEELLTVLEDLSKIHQERFIKAGIDK